MYQQGADAGATGKIAEIGQLGSRIGGKGKILAEPPVVTDNTLVIPVEIVLHVIAIRPIGSLQPAELLVLIGIDKVEVTGSLQAEAQGMAKLDIRPNASDKPVVRILIAVLIYCPERIFCLVDRA